jgi:hypothetical protein
MFNDPESGVVIAGGRSGLRLHCVGEPDDVGCPTLIEARAGPFSGAVRDDTVGPYAEFRRHLKDMYDTLSGTATLRSDDGFELVLTCNGLGAIAVSAEVVAEHVPLIRLTFEFEIDQSYLPDIIRRIAREFPSC